MALLRGAPGRSSDEGLERRREVEKASGTLATEKIRILLFVSGLVITHQSTVVAETAHIFSVVLGCSRELAGGGALLRSFGDCALNGVATLSAPTSDAPYRREDWCFRPI
jgi:hypothetical protein